MVKLIDDTDLQIIADEIMSNVRLLELADEDTAEDDLDLYLPKIKRAAEDLNSIVSTSTPDGGTREARDNGSHTVNT